MTEIKFACPHCGQHIACDRDYSAISILCPSCNQPLEVPRLSALEASHPAMLVVASTPKPKERFRRHIPTIGVWTEDEWEEHYRAAASPPQATPAWLMAGLGTVIAAALLKAALVPTGAVIACVLAGTVLSCYLATKQGPRASGSRAHGGMDGVLSSAARIGLLLLAIPLVAIGLLFVGCTLCN